jgi:hypothetical protein
MEKLEIVRIGIEVVGTLVLGYLANKTFKFKDALTKVIAAAKDSVITETEFQEIVDAVKKDLYGK